jgi:plastocyanin
VLFGTFKIWFFGALVALCLAGCGRDETADTRTPQTGEGVITGRVVFSGAAPESKIIPGSPMAPDESLVVGPRNGLKNVIVFLVDAPKASFVLQTPAVLDQVKCIYTPHVLAVQTGQTLRLKSSDSVMHNVHLKCQVNPDANYGFPTAGQKDISFALAEAPFPVKCDVHPWMSAWIGVFDHPWFAVTAEDGSFTIRHVPPGHYTLAAWQEVLPQQQQTIDVAATGQTEADFTFQAP